MPKRIAHLRDALRETFAEPIGWLAAAIGAVFVLLLTVLMSNTSLLGFILRERLFTGWLKLAAALQVIWSGRLILTHDGRWPILLLAALFGLNAALIVHYMRRQAGAHRAAGASAFGVLVGLLGVGCAACGSVFLSSLIGIGATVGALRWLPLHGLEFTWLGILLIIGSMFSVARKIVEPEACAIPGNR